MKKFITVIILICSYNALSQQNLNLPFIGTKYFNFYGGSCCNESITIEKDGQCIIKGYEAPEWGNNVIIPYKGKYSNIIWILDDYGKRSYGYKIENEYITLLDKLGKPEIGCLEEDTICKVPLDF